MSLCFGFERNNCHVEMKKRIKAHFHQLHYTNYFEKHTTVDYKATVQSRWAINRAEACDKSPCYFIVSSNKLFPLGFSAFSLHQYANLSVSAKHKNLFGKILSNLKFALKWVDGYCTADF